MWPAAGTRVKNLYYIPLLSDRYTITDMTLLNSTYCDHEIKTVSNNCPNKIFQKKKKKVSF